jgi:hypothetical protein
MNSKGIIITIIIGLSIPILIGLLTYGYQEWDKRKTALSERRRVLYESLIRSLVELLGARTAVERSRLLTEIETGWLFASDEVLDASYRYLAVYDNVLRSATEDDSLDWHTVLVKFRSDAAIRQELRNRLSEVFVGMRRDIRSGTKITEDWARQRVDIYCWGIVSVGEHV